VVISITMAVLYMGALVDDTKEFNQGKSKKDIPQT